MRYLPVLSRAYEDEEDLEAMARLVSEAWALQGPHFECAIGDLDWRMYRSATVRPRDNLRLWHDARGGLVGFAWYSPNGDVDLVLHPREHAPTVVPEMLAWAREHHPAVSDRPLTAWALEGNGPLTAALQGLGWRRSGGCYLHLARPLAGAREEARVPPGYGVRSLRGPEEAAARAAVHRLAFGSERVTTEVYQRLMRAPRYRLDLDLVVEAPGGELAALALCWWDERNRMGEFEPVATAPAHRRRGLARALVQEGLRRLEGAGARLAIVYALADNPDSVSLYTALGFQSVDRNWGYRAPSCAQAISVSDFGM